MGTNLHQISGQDSPIICAEQVYFEIPKNCTVLKRSNCHPIECEWKKKAQNGTKFCGF